MLLSSTCGQKEPPSQPNMPSLNYLNLLLAMKLPKLFVYVDTNMCDVFRNLGKESQSYLILM